MKKVLLVGELNQTVSSVNKHLSTRFQTQICVDSLEMVKGMAKVFAPDMAVVCLVGTGELDRRILDFFEQYDAKMPILLIGTTEECKAYQTYYENGQVDYAIRPTKLSALMKKCLIMLRMAEDDAVEPQSESVDEPQRRKRILAVDDSGVLLRSVKAMLDKNYDISVATDGEMAMKQAKKKMPDLILLDYEMPGWDGKRTLEEIRKHEELKDIPVLFLTGVADREHISAVLGLKPEGYLLKPIEQQKLLDTIEKVLSGTV